MIEKLFFILLVNGFEEARKRKYQCSVQLERLDPEHMGSTGL